MHIKLIGNNFRVRSTFHRRLGLQASRPRQQHPQKQHKSASKQRDRLPGRDTAQRVSGLPRMLSSTPGVLSAGVRRLTERGAQLPVFLAALQLPARISIRPWRR